MGKKDTGRKQEQTAPIKEPRPDRLFFGPLPQPFNKGPCYKEGPLCPAPVGLSAPVPPQGGEVRSAALPEMISQSPPHPSSRATARDLARQTLPPWKASRQVTSKQSLPAVCILRRPSHTLSRGAWGCSLPSSSLSWWPPQGTGQGPLLSSHCPGGQGPPGEPQVRQPKTCRPPLPQSVFPGQQPAVGAPL